MNKSFFVKLEVRTGGFEKITHHIVEAVNAAAAGVEALEAECHDAADCVVIDGVMHDCGGEWVYEVVSVTEIEGRDLKTLRRFF